VRIEGAPRTIKSATYTPSAERTDDATYVLGAVVYVRFNECDHVKLGNPSMDFKVGASDKCRECAR
jgi:hypothetical protein